MISIALVLDIGEARMHVRGCGFGCIKALIECLRYVTHGGQ